MNYVRPTIYCLCVVVFATRAVVAEPVIWDVSSGGNGHSYEFINEPSSWVVASLAAESRGGYLATITSQAENEFIFNLAQTVFGDSPYEYWLGGFQPLTAFIPTDQWQWVTGEPWSYTDWGVGEPNDYSGIGSEQWLGMWNLTNPAWNDFLFISSGNQGYVLEIDTVVPEPASIVLAATGLIALALYRGRKIP